METAAGSAGVAYSTFRRWMIAGETDKKGGEFREFREAVLKALHESEATLVRDLRKHARRNSRAALDMLQRRFRHRWGRRERLEVTGRGGGPISLVAEAKRALAVPEIRQALNQIAKYAPPALPEPEEGDRRQFLGSTP